MGLMNTMKGNMIFKVAKKDYQKSKVMLRKKKKKKMMSNPLARLKL